MINIPSSNTHLTAYTLGSSPRISSNSNNPSQDQVRFVNNCTEVFDVASWLALNDNITVGMTPEAESALTWFRKRQQQEKQWTKIVQQHTAVINALAAREQAEAALSVVARLCGELETW